MNIIIIGIATGTVNASVTVIVIVMCYILYLIYSLIFYIPRYFAIINLIDIAIFN